MSVKRVVHFKSRITQIKNGRSNPQISLSDSTSIPNPTLRFSQIFNTQNLLLFSQSDTSALVAPLIKQRNPIRHTNTSSSFLNSMRRHQDQNLDKPSFSIFNLLPAEFPFVLDFGEKRGMNAVPGFRFISRSS